MDKEFVEIAGIKWATMNVGAEKETDIGLYFQWGDAQGYSADEVGPGEDEKLFNRKSYKHDLDITKYNKNDGKAVLDAEDDAVTAAWGDGWRMPTSNEFVALGNAVNTEWTNDYKGSGVAGMICTDKADSSKVLFFPACGYCLNDSVYNVGISGYYWSSSLYGGDAQYAHRLLFYSRIVLWHDYIYRSCGFPVRGVAINN